MSTQNRATLIGRIHKVLKKHYSPVHPPDRPVLEQMLYACCLENAGYKAADEAYHALSTNFFDWNEVRVSTAKELAEAVQMLPDPVTTATNFRSLLQSVFETTYSFELEPLRKMNLGPAQEQLQKLRGSTPFSVAYVTQTALGGHWIPLDKGALEALCAIGLIDEAEAAGGSVAGLERAIPKNKGTEFGSLLHQLAAGFVANPYSTNLHKLLVEISPDAKIPKRPPKKPAEPATPPPAPAKTEPAGKSGSVEKAADSAGKKKPAESKKKPAEARLPEKKPVASEKKPTPTDKKPPVASVKKPSGAGLAKRKPR